MWYNYLDNNKFLLTLYESVSNVVRCADKQS